MLNENKLLRRIIIPMLRKYNLGDISIDNYYSNMKIKLHTFQHKGYWYHGRKREEKTMKLFGQLIMKEDLVIEVGGHIGYISQYFSKLVGDNGRVIVFEPGLNNLPYILFNVQKCNNVQIVQEAISNRVGKASFYIENLTGQNNSLIKDFKGTIENKKVAFVDNNIQEVIVDTTTLDAYCLKSNITPNFIKIDIEGAENLAIKGMLNMLKEHKPILMIEIQDNYSEIFNTLKEYGYCLYNEDLKELNNYSEIHLNTFCIHKDKIESINLI